MEESNYWNCLDNESRKFVLRQYAPNFSESNINGLVENSYEEIEKLGYSSLIEKAVQKDIETQSKLC